jgi:hypothetical protein
VIADHGRVWTLHRGDDGELLADLVVTGGDFPWLHGRVHAHEGLAGVRPLFAEELRLLESIDDDVAFWERSYEQVREAVNLRYPDGREVPEFLLHIDGDQAWWRWSDQPFQEES